MGNFNRDRGGDRRGGGGGFNRDRGDRPTMHKAICDACKQSCEVPFKPSGDKPIYCSDCFSKQGGGSDRPRFGGGDRDRRPRFEDKGAGPRDSDYKDILKGVKTLNYKLDELIKILGSQNTRVSIETTNEEAVPASKKVAKKKASPKKVAKKKAAKKK